MSKLLKLDSSTIDNALPEDFTVYFPSGIRLDGAYEVALINANLWYSWFNIASYYDNNDIRIHNGNRWVNIKIPDGIYDIDQLNEFINRYLVSAKEDPDMIKLIPNFSTLKVIIELKANCQFDLSRC